MKVKNKHPEWALKHKKPGTELRLLKGRYYLYEVSSKMKRLWESIAAEAERKGWSGPTYLSNLCEHEIADRQRRRLGRHLVEAQLPKGKTLENYDFSKIGGIKKSKILALATGEIWIKDGMNVLIFGASGVGKTHLAAAIGEKLIEGDFRVFFTCTTELLQKLQAAKRALNLPAALEKLESMTA